MAGAPRVRTYFLLSGFSETGCNLFHGNYDLRQSPAYGFEPAELWWVIALRELAIIYFRSISLNRISQGEWVIKSTAYFNAIHLLSLMSVGMMHWRRGDNYTLVFRISQRFVGCI